jgi:hypothetical protein
MKALSIKQPWAWMIANGQKTIETRTRRTHYRGPLLICASLKADKVWRQWAEAAIDGLKPSDLLYGQAICIADVVDCHPMTKADEDAARHAVYDNAFAWVLANVRRIEPFDVRGQQNFFDVDVSERNL